ncbi:MAG TPA: glycosyl hydrolase family 28 protein [Allosphingosinicella sp.]|nr:glycosyl hydrolase family 28 protein [Allosphingosinicella sp.]
MNPIRNPRLACWSIVGFAALCAAPALAAAPVRTFWGTVAEPSYPTKICATLPAAITAHHWSVDDVDADGVRTHPDHDRIQTAIDACHGGAVKLIAGPQGENAFLSSPLTLRSGVTLWVDKGITLFASRDPRDYDTGDGFCGTATNEHHRSCRAFINGRELDDSGIVGEGSIDGRGGSRLLAGPNKGKASWWDLAMLSKHGLSQNVFRLVALDGGSRLTLYRTTFENSPNFHVVPNAFHGITAWGIKILSPSAEYSRPDYACPPGTTPAETESATCFTPDTVKNTDGFDPGQSSDVLLAYSWISDGDDDVAIKAGGTAPSRDQVYAHNHFYYGHGMSIGSETNAGAEHILVTDLVMDGMDSPNGNGLRIKSDASRGGPVRDVAFEHICMRREARPMVFDTYYSDRPGTKLPDFQGITVRDFHYFAGGRYGAGTSVFRGFVQPGTRLPLQVTLDTIVFEGGVPSVSSGKDKEPPMAAHISLAGPNAFRGVLTPSAADDVSVTSVPSTVSGPLVDCGHAFVPLSSVMADSPI